MRWVPIQDPAVQVNDGWAVWQDGLQRGAYIRDHTGQQPYFGQVSVLGMDAVLDGAVRSEAVCLSNHMGNSHLVLRAGVGWTLCLARFLQS
jgi:autotransporter translocation and assembly factor TamB